MAGPQRRRRSGLSLVQQEPDVRFYTHRLEEAQRGPVLVLGAANGRVAWELARHSSRVVAVEPSERMMAAAEAQRAEQPADVAARLRFMRADLRSLRLNEEFALVAAPQNALGLLTSRADLEALVTTVRLHLQLGGMFVFDVLNPRPSPVLPPEVPNLLEPTRPVFAPHLAEARRGRTRGTAALHRWRLRLFGAEEVDETLRAGGLTPRERYGHFDGKPFEPTDDLQVVIAEREQPGQLS